MSSVINHEWAIARLRNYLEIAEIEYVPSPSRVVGAQYYKLVRSKAEVQAETQVIEQILDRVLSGWRTADWPEPRKEPMWREREACHRAIAQLGAAQELAENLGTAAPQLDSSALHPWVWGSVQGLWSSGHYREAVGAAARAINAQAQSKLGRRDASEHKLLSDAFSIKPPELGHPRLRLTPDDGSDTYRNRHEGAGSFARGLYAALRNPLAHEEDVELTEHEALEQLAAFSILARWVETAKVERAS